MNETLVEPQYILNKGQLFDHYEIIEELGRGGMGIVYKVFDTHLQRIVALKLILQNTEKAQHRFLLESTAMAKFENPNIARIYEIKTSPTPYFTMEYIEGITLADGVYSGEIKSTFLVTIMIKVCNALQKIHKEGILHRDLKPSNIMINNHNEPKIMDFGLVKFSDEEFQSVSKSGAIIGTLSYMAPEQIRGKETEKSDIYSIGACLYEALTLKKLYQGDTELNILYQILHSYPIPPRELNPDISPYLEAICLKCLAKKPHRRYQDFRTLALELKNYENNRPIIAKKYTTWRKIQQTIYHHRILFAVICLVLTTTLSTFIVAYIKIKNALVAVQKEQQESDEVSSAILESLFYSIRKHDDLQKDNNFRKPIEKILAKLDSSDSKKRYLHLAGIIAYERGDLKKALADLRSSTINTPQYFSFINVGVACFYLEQYHEAIDFFNHAISIDPKTSKAYYYKANSLIKLEQYHEAIPCLNNAIDIESEDVEYYRARGQAFYRIKDFTKAIEDYNIAIKKELSNDMLRYERGRIHLDQKNFERAEKDFTNAIKLNKENTGAYFNRAYIFTEQKKWESAIDDYSKLIDRNKKSDAGYRARGYAHYNQENYADAIRDWQKAQQLNIKKHSNLNENIAKAKLKLLQQQK